MITKTKQNKIFLNLDVEKALSSYLGAKGLDHKTQSKYLEFYHKMANVHGELNQENIDEFLKYNDYSSSRAMVRHLIRAIHRWDFPLEIKGFVMSLDIPKRTGKREKKKPLHMTQKELEYLIEKMRGDSIIDVRNRLSILTQWWGGLRISELLGISFKDLNVENYNSSKEFQKIKISSESAKFKKERDAYIPNFVYLGIVDYVKQRIRINPNFLNTLDGGENIWGFRKSSYDKLVRGKTKLFLGRAYNTHSLRHGRATNLIKKGVPLLNVKEIMGHQDISSTQIYTHLSNEDIEESLR